GVGDGGVGEGRWRGGAVENCEEGGDALPVAELAPAHAAVRLATLAQFVGLVIAVEGERERAARAILPLRRTQGPPRADVVDEAAPVFFRPLPGFEIARGFVHGVLLY